MIRLTVFLLVILANIKSPAQTPFDKERYEQMLLKKGLITIEGGIAFPFKEFADNSLANARSGYAKNGNHISATFRYAITPTFGLSLRYFNSSNPFDASKMQSDLKPIYSPTSISFTSDPYSINGLMIGPTFIIPSPKMNIETSIFLGKLSGILPANATTFDPPMPVSINGVQLTKFTNTYQGSSEASNYAVSFEAAFKYLIGANFIFSASIEILICDLTFSNLTINYTDTASNTYYSSLPDYLQPFRLVHAKVGIGYQFD